MHSINYLLNKLVSINSEYPHEKKISDFVFSYLVKKGLRPKKQYIDRQQDRYTVYCEKGKGRKSIMLYGHLDTVGITKGWCTNPFSLHLTGGKAFGLGVFDMKSGVAAAIDAFVSYQPKDFRLKLALCVDEENISQGAYTLVRSPFMKKVDCVLSFEPSFAYGNQGIVIGRMGRVVLDVKIEAAPEHVMYYKPSKDCVLFAAEFINGLKKLYKKNGNKKKFVFVRNMKAVTVGLSTVQSVDLELDCAVLPHESHELVKKSIASLLDRLVLRWSSIFRTTISAKQRKTPFLEPYEQSLDNPYLMTLTQSIQSITQKNAVSYFRSSLADENVFGAKGITTLSIGPFGGNAHAPNEWVSLDSVRTLQHIILDFLKRTDRLLI